MKSAAEYSPGEQQFFDRLGYWQRVLRQADEDVVARFRNEAIAELDSLCMYNGMECEFSGNAIFPTYAPDGAVTSVENGKLDMGRGVCNGLNILTNEEGLSEVWYEFIIGKYTDRPNPLQSDTRILLTYLDPNDSIVLPLGSTQQTKYDEDVPVHEILGKASDALKLKVNSKSFRKLGKEAQRQFIDDYLRQYEQETGIAQKQIAVQGIYFYLQPKPGEGALGEKVGAFNGEYIAGNCVSLGFLEGANLAEAPIRKKRDLIDKLAGLCLVVEAGDYYPELSLCKGDIVYVPISSQEIEALVA